MFTSANTETTFSVQGKYPHGHYLALFHGHGGPEALKVVRGLDHFADMVTDPIEALYQEFTSHGTTASGVGVVFVVIDEDASLISVHKCGRVACRVHVGDVLVHESSVSSTADDYLSFTETFPHRPVAKPYLTSDSNVISVHMVEYESEEGTVLLPSHEFLGHNELGGPPLRTTTHLSYQPMEFVSVSLYTFELNCLMNHRALKDITTAPKLVEACNRLFPGVENIAAAFYRSKDAPWWYASMCIPRIMHNETTEEVHAKMVSIVGPHVWRVEAFTFPHGQTSMFIHFNPCIPSKTNGVLHNMIAKLQRTPSFNIYFRSTKHHWILTMNTSADNLRPFETGIVDEEAYATWDTVSDYMQHLESLTTSNHAFLCVEDEPDVQGSTV